ncbi:MAG: hypothetical protein JKX76_04210, partial [Colwellia sp.]|nr:hypothetical protein [Colwellia sp.]
MYNLYKSAAVVGILLFSCTAFSQEFIKGLPDDLPKAKVLFLKYEITKQASRKPTSKEEKIIYNRVSTHNKKVEKANKDLASALKSYPYEYKICTREEVEKWGKEGYKYVLDSDMFTQMSNGFRQDKSRSVHG